jgi:phospholipid transport system substrate-binding protein
MSVLLIERRSLSMIAIFGIIALPERSTAQSLAEIAAPIQHLNAALLEVMRAGRTTTFNERFDTLAPSLDRALNVPFILQSAVGLNWASLPTQQQSQLLTAFRAYTLATYVSQFATYSGQRFEVLPGLRALPNGDQVLHTQIISASGNSRVLDYVMHRADDLWKAVDVLLDGSISRLAILRSDFRQLLTNRGASALTSELQRRATGLAAG